MNYSIYSADRATHLKIVVLALLAATTFSGLSLFLHSTTNAIPATTTVLIKAGMPTAVSSSTITLIR